MITRDVNQERAVVAVNQFAYDASCGSLNGVTSTANHFAGHIIDRLGLGANYNSVLLHAAGVFDMGTSTVDTHFGAIGSWLYHSSTTCAADFDRYSTGSEQSVAKAFVSFGPSTTSTLAGGLMATACTTSTTSASGYFTATATGFGYADYIARYDLSGAGRYLRAFAIPEVYASSSGGSVIRGHVDLIFGEPDNVTSLPATSTGTLWTS